MQNSKETPETVTMSFFEQYPYSILKSHDFLCCSEQVLSDVEKEILF
jgi:hypothetical protein